MEYGGYECSKKRMYVMLYPNTSYEEGFLESGDDIPSAIHDAMQQLESYGSISYYSLDRFDTSNYNYPDLNISTWEDIRDGFRSFLEDGSKNGTGTNLKNGYIGSHLLVHSEGCSADDSIAAYEASDSCSDNSSAFSRGVMSWTGSECNLDSGLRKNSAIQEPLHTFIRYEDIEGIHDLTNDNDGTIRRFEEHRLGEVSDFDVTPLLTYHADEDPREKGDCDGDGTSVDGHTQQLTWCTKEAVKLTADNQCVEQIEPSWCDNIETTGGEE